MLVGGLSVAIAIAVSPSLRGRAAMALATGAIVIGLSAPAAYTLSTVNTPHSGALPTAGPAGAASRFGPGGGRALAGGPGFGGGPNFGGNAGGNLGGGFAPPNFGGNAGGNFGGGFAPPNLGGGPGAGRGALGGLLDGSNPGAQITALLKSSTGYRWTAAAIGANNASGYQLASGKAIMAIGGFNGTDPTPTLAQFEQYVRENKIHYFIASGGGFGGPGGGLGAQGGGASTSSAISQWVQSNFSAQTVDGVTIYDLSSAG